MRKGIVALTGNAHVGIEWDPSEDYKGPVDGTYVTDGWGGSAEDSRVFSDNGSAEPYDLGDGYSMPMFEDTWIDPDTLEPIHNPATGTWYTHAQYFTEVLVGGPDRTAAGGTYDGNVTIASKTGFYYNATTGVYKTGTAANAIVPNPNDHFILKKTTSPIIQINGAIHIDGDLTFDKADLYYTGRAAIMVEGTVTNKASLLTVNSKTNVNDYANSFPVRNCMGLMSRGDMILCPTGVSQTRIMGAFYSAGLVSSAMQTVAMGTMIGTNFEMGNQVPDIYQVPSLARNLPLGMIGDYPILRVKLASWREIGV